MSLYLKLNDAYIPVIRASVDWVQNESGRFDVSVRAAFIDRNNVVGANAALYWNGNPFITGFVYDSPELILDNDVLVVNLGCLDELGRLACKRAKSNAHYQDTPVSTIVQDLLSGTDWILSDTSTMVDANEKTTIDLRSKETLWGQIIETVQSIPNCFVRYDGYNAALNKHQLAVGFFGKETIWLRQGVNLTKLQMTKNTNQVYYIVEPYGAKSPTQRLTLVPALNYPNITSHPDYARFPIVINNGAYVVADTQSPTGCEITKFFGSNKTKNDRAPTPAELSAASYALWRRTVQFMKQNASHKTFSASAVLDAAPLASDAARVTARVEEPVYNTALQQTEWRETFAIDEPLRITKVRTQFEIGKPLEYTLELSDNAYAEEDDESLELYKRLESHEQSDDNAGVFGIKGQLSVSVTHTPSDPASASCNNTGREYIIPVPTPPQGASALFYVYSANPANNVTMTLLQAPALPNTPLRLCVRVNGTWPGPEPITVTTLFTFS